MKNTTNVFSEGLTKDMHPLTTQQQTYTDALNATLITRNGNEFMMLNDMGNTLIQDSKTGNIMGLREGFVPVGIKEHGGVMYIASVNKDGDGEIGTIPSPVIEFNLNQAEIKNHNIELSELTLVPIADKTYLNCGDKFAIALDLDDDDITIKYLSTNGSSYNKQENKYHTLTTSIINPNYATNKGLYKLKLFSQTANNIYDISYLTEQKYTTFIKLDDSNSIINNNWYYDTLNKSDENSEVLSENILFDIDKMLIQDQVEGSNLSFIKYPNLPEGLLYISLEKEKLNIVQLSTNPYTGKIHPITINEGDVSYSLVFPQIWYDSDCAEHIDKIQVRVKNSKNELCILKDTASWCEGGSKITDTTLTFEIDKNTLCRGKMQNDRWFRLYSSELGSSFPVTEALMKIFYSNSLFYNLFVLENATLNEWYTLEIDCYLNLNLEELIYKYNCRFNLFYFDNFKEIKIENIVAETYNNLVSTGLFRQVYNNTSDFKLIDLFNNISDQTFLAVLNIDGTSKDTDLNPNNSLQSFKITVNGTPPFKYRSLLKMNDGDYLYGIHNILVHIYIYNSTSKRTPTFFGLGVSESVYMNLPGLLSRINAACFQQKNEIRMDIVTMGRPFHNYTTYGNTYALSIPSILTSIYNINLSDITNLINTLYIDLTSQPTITKINDIIKQLNNITNIKKSFNGAFVSNNNSKKKVPVDYVKESKGYRLNNAELKEALGLKSSTRHDQLYYTIKDCPILNLKYSETYDDKLINLPNTTLYKVIPLLNVTITDSNQNTNILPAGYYLDDNNTLIKESCNLDTNNLLNNVLQQYYSSKTTCTKGSSIKDSDGIISKYTALGISSSSVKLNKGLFYININTTQSTFNIHIYDNNNLSFSLNNERPDGLIVISTLTNLYINFENEIQFNSFGLYKIKQNNDKSVLNERLTLLMNDATENKFILTDLNKYVVPQVVYNFKETDVKCLDKVYNFNIAPAEGYLKLYGTYEWDKNYPDKTTVDLQLPDGTTMSNVQYRFKDEEL